MFSSSVVLSALLCLVCVQAQILDFAANPNPFQSFWPFQPQFNFGFLRPQQPWWKGPNVCIEKRNTDKDKEANETRANQQLEGFDETIANHFQAALTFSSCVETPDVYECTTKSNIHGDEQTHTVRYKCCHGFVRSRQQGICVIQDELKPLLEVLQRINATSFREMIKIVGLDDKLTKENYTVFSPLNEALENVTDELSEMNNVDVAKRESGSSANDVVLSHLVPGIVDINDYNTEDLLYSENQNSTIRLNYYPTPSGGKLVTANCIRIARANIFASNGIVHKVDDVIPILKKTIEEIINEDSRFSYFRRAMESLKLTNIYEQNDQHTIFVPTNEAFEKLDGKLREKILSGKGCAATIIKHHITPHTVCSAAVVENATVHDLGEDIINMERKSDEEVYIDGRAKVIEDDILATDGVIHVLDNVLIPESAQELADVISNKNLLKFQDIVERAGLTDALANMKNVTLFIPFDEAFEEPDAADYIQRNENNPEKLKELVLYHAVRGEMETSDMESGVLPTELEGKSLRFKVYPLFGNLFLKTLSPPPMVQCASLTRSEEKACGVMVHEIDKVLIPPSRTLLEMLDGDSRLSTFRSLLQGTELEEKLNDPSQNLTVLAATNYSFGKYKYDLEALRENKTLADHVLRRHVIRKPVCCQELNYGDQIFNRWSPYSDPFPGGASQVIKDCDRIATNGILHTVAAFMYRHV